jgi:hypothetical protein
MVEDQHGEQPMTDQTKRHESGALDNIGDQVDLHPEDRPGLEKDPNDWVTGDEPMTGAQASYLETLSRQTGEQVPADLTKADASRKIDELRDSAGLPERTGRPNPDAGR